MNPSYICLLLVMGCAFLSGCLDSDSQEETTGTTYEVARCGNGVIEIIEYWDGSFIYSDTFYSDEYLAYGNMTMADFLPYMGPIGSALCDYTYDDLANMSDEAIIALIENNTEEHIYIDPECLSAAEYDGPTNTVCIDMEINTSEPHSLQTTELENGNIRLQFSGAVIFPEDSGPPKSQNQLTMMVQCFI